MSICFLTCYYSLLKWDKIWYCDTFQVECNKCWDTDHLVSISSLSFLKNCCFHKVAIGFSSTVLVLRNIQVQMCLGNYANVWSYWKLRWVYRWKKTRLGIKAFMPALASFVWCPACGCSEKHKQKCCFCSCQFPCPCPCNNECALVALHGRSALCSIWKFPRTGQETPPVKVSLFTPENCRVSHRQLSEMPLWNVACPVDHLRMAQVGWLTWGLLWPVNGDTALVTGRAPSPPSTAGVSWAPLAFAELWVFHM